MWECPDEPLLRAWLRGLRSMAEARGFSSEQWGESGGLPLFCLARGGSGPRVYLSAGIHGDEPAGPHAIERLVREEKLDRLVEWTICPLLNPRGLLSGTREGPCGRDYNRDYLNPRTEEMAAHCGLIQRRAPFDLYLSLHEDWEADGFYLYEINTSGRPGFAAEILGKVSEILAPDSAEVIDGHPVVVPGFIEHEPEPDEPLGWPEAIYHSKLYPHLSYTFETPSTFPLERRVEALVVAVQAAVGEFLRCWEISAEDQSPLDGGLKL